jgi:putative flippase GtrA
MIAHSRRAPRYIAVSLICVIVNNALLIGLDAAGVHYWVSVLVSAAVMIPLSFSLQARITYRTAPDWGQSGRYFAVMIVNTPCAWAILWAIHDRGGLAMVYASPITIGILFLWNYIGTGWAILRRRSA